MVPTHNSDVHVTCSIVHGSVSNDVLEQMFSSSQVKGHTVTDAIYGAGDVDGDGIIARVVRSSVYIRQCNSDIVHPGICGISLIGWACDERTFIVCRQKNNQQN